MTETYLPSSPLAAAILALVRSSVPETCAIYEGQAPSAAEPPYAVLYFDSGRKSAFERNILNEAPRDLRYQTTCVGSTPEHARWVADKVGAALYGAVPAVPGRLVWPVIEEASQPIRRDDESLTSYLATSQWLTRSEAA